MTSFLQEAIVIISELAGLLYVATRCCKTATGFLKEVRKLRHEFRKFRK